MHLLVSSYVSSYVPSYVYRDVHKKLTHVFYNFHGTKRRKDEFADTKTIVQLMGFYLTGV